MREGIQNLSITIKIINLKSDIKNGTSVGYNYDHNGNTTEKSIMFGGKTQTHKYEYDVDNKITTYIDALNRRIEYEYDANANKTKRKCQMAH